MELAETLAGWIAPWHEQAGAAKRSGFVVGISGAQGTGKTTLARALVPALAARGLRAVAVSLDDFYLTHAEREQLGREVHPLFAMRGLPGTHDLQLAHATLDALQRGPAGTAVVVPRFDKGRDDRAPEPEWPEYTRPIDVVLLEGYCLGAQPELDPAALATPINALERDEDPHAIARSYANARLAGPYQAFFARLSRLIFLRAPDMEAVLRWRSQQERELLASAGPRAPAAQSGPELERFVQSFERITRRMLASPPAADLTVELDAEHRAVALA